MDALADVQAQAGRIARLYETSFGIPPGDDWVVFKLQEELGELTQAYLAATGRSRHRLEGGEARSALEREIADVLGFVLVLSDRLGIDAAGAFRAKWGRYEDRP